MVVYTDASYADIKDDKFRSTAGFIIHLNNSLISWKTKKLKWVCCSTAESEYLGVYFGAREAIGLARLIKDFHDKDVFPIKIKIDNKAVLHIIKNTVSHNATRHFATKYYALQEWLQKKLITLEYVNTKDNYADQMTKIVRKDFLRFRNYLLVQRGSVGNYNSDKLEDDNSERADVKSRHEQFRENVERVGDNNEETLSV